ncbi:MAG TPA: cation transporter [Acidobacteriota bacterium]|jgi:copper chaperone|nr:cation transporter [Acidobacteriota bacterium]
MKALTGSVLLLSVLGWAAWFTTRPAPASAADKATQPAQLEKITLKVEGMTCGGCAIGVKKTLEKQKGVRKADVSFEKGQAIAEVEKGKVKPEELAAAVTKFGYKATVVKNK